MCLEYEEIDLFGESWQYYEVNVNVKTTTLCVYRYINGSNTSEKNDVVLICVGFGNNANIINLLGEKSLPEYLSKNNYDVWVFDYRGHGKSITSAKNWDLSSYAFEDGVAVVQYILQETCRNSLHWIGHSMGGIIGLGLASCPENAHYFLSVTALGSSIYLHHSIYWYAFNLTPLYPMIYCSSGISLNWWTKYSSYLLHATPCFPSCGIIDNVASLKNTGRKNSDILMRKGFCYEPLGVVKDMKKGFLVNGICMQNGSKQVFIKKSIGSHCKNICLFYGAEDFQITEADVLKLKEDIIRNNKYTNLLICGFGKKFGQQPYSHFDLILGKDAPNDVFPRLLSFLNSISVSKVL